MQPTSLKSGRQCVRILAKFGFRMFGASVRISVLCLFVTFPGTYLRVEYPKSEHFRYKKKIFLYTKWPRLVEFVRIFDVEVAQICLELGPSADFSDLLINLFDLLINFKVIFVNLLIKNIPNLIKFDKKNRLIRYIFILKMRIVMLSSSEFVGMWFWIMDDSIWGP